MSICDHQTKKQDSAWLDRPTKNH